MTASTWLLLVGLAIPTAKACAVTERRTYPIGVDFSGPDANYGCYVTRTIASAYGGNDYVQTVGWNYLRSYHRGILMNGQCPDPGYPYAIYKGLQPIKKYRYYIYQIYTEGAYLNNKLSVQGGPEVVIPSTSGSCEEPTAVGAAISDAAGEIRFDFTRVAWHVVLSGIYLEPVGPENTQCPYRPWYFLQRSTSSTPVRCGKQGFLQCAADDCVNCPWNSYTSAAASAGIKAWHNMQEITVPALCPHEIACPGWGGSVDGQNACTVLGCNGANEPEVTGLTYKSTWPILFDFYDDGLLSLDGLDSSIRKRFAEGSRDGMTYMATMSGWSHTRTYHKGYIQNGAVTPHMHIKGLQPNTEYEWAIYQYATQYGGQNKISINGGPVWDTRDNTCENPSSSGKIFSSATGTLDFEFTRSSGTHVSVAALGIKPGPFYGCPSVRPTHYYNFVLNNLGNVDHGAYKTFTYNSNGASLALYNFDYSRTYQDGFLNAGGGGSTSTATVSGLSPNRRYGFHIYTWCSATVSMAWYVCGTNKFSVNGGSDIYYTSTTCPGKQVAGGVATTDGSGRLVFTFTRQIDHLGLSQLGIDHEHGEFPARLWGCGQLQWTDSFKRLFNNPEENPDLDPGTATQSGTWYGMENDPDFYPDTEGTFFQYKSFQAMLAHIPEQEAIMELSQPKPHHWKSEWNHVLLLQDKTGWKWAGSSTLGGENTALYPILANLPGVTVGTASTGGAVSNVQITSWLTGSQAGRDGTIAHDADALWKYLACTGKIRQVETTQAAELAQIHHCATTSIPGGNPNAGATYTFSSSDCGGSTAFGSQTCLFAVKRGMQQGQPEDWRGYNNPPKVRWWMQTASTGVNIALDYLCPDADTRLASDFSSHFCYTNVGTASTPLSRLHTYTSAECGNDPPPHNGRDCLAVFAMRSQSGRDKQWEVLQRDKATTFRWQCPGCTARINVKVHYLCPKLTHRDMSPWKIYRCYHHFWNAGTGWIQHTWTAGDCEGHLPSSGAKCFSGYRAGFYQGTSENMKVYDKEEGFYFEWECNDCTGSARVAADYVCYEP